MKFHHRISARLLVTAALLSTATVAAAQNIEVYKRSSCGCCTKWVDHMRANGFAPKVHEMDDLDPIKKKLGVPMELGSCHTAHVGGYVIEGHVPADLVRKLLKERPKARGLAVPSMPAGSPGMEGPHKVDYEVLLIKPNGQYSTYAKR
ncbi:DUF411 domain-containing protein [Janthinobacterium fluminis]|uniref:DUF411 domain-containing protein n=1 Tax=Janthinobacterium fluminis TaxID=2987524 RepID=A0ABT5JXP2_9BURK|nr:DUF411 domain-containing protein [Janthinobacterium fluminis]MDC8756925.1 DUF411 domain-containing protein [Janthinobacterium fluminis]